jgi:hypothetical protein
MNGLISLPSDLQAIVLLFLNYQDVIRLESSCQYYLLFINQLGTWTRLLEQEAPELLKIPHLSALPHKIVFQKWLVNKSKKNDLLNQIAALKEKTTLERNARITQPEHKQMTMVGGFDPLTFNRLYLGMFRSYDKYKRKEKIKKLEQLAMSCKL